MFHILEIFNLKVKTYIYLEKSTTFIDMILHHTFDSLCLQVDSWLVSELNAITVWKHNCTIQHKSNLTPSLKSSDKPMYQS